MHKNGTLAISFASSSTATDLQPLITHIYSNYEIQLPWLISLHNIHSPVWSNSCVKHCTSGLYKAWLCWARKLLITVTDSTSWQPHSLREGSQGVRMPCADVGQSSVQFVTPHNALLLCVCRQHVSEKHTQRISFNYLHKSTSLSAAMESQKSYPRSDTSWTFYSHSEICELLNNWFHNSKKLKRISWEK